MNDSTPEQVASPQFGMPQPAQMPAMTPAAAPLGAPSLQAAQTGPIGKVRSTGMCFVLMIVTVGIYSLFWYANVHSEMKKHTGSGIGGGLAVLLALVFGVVSPFLVSGEVGGLYERRGQPKPVSALTGLWCFLPLVGLIIWFAKTNGALNSYWRSLGAS